MPRSQDNIIVTAGHDVFGTHDPFFHGGCQASLEQDGFVLPSAFPGQSSAYYGRPPGSGPRPVQTVQHVGAHYLSHYRQTGFSWLPATNPVRKGPYPGKNGRGPRLKSAATQQRSAAQLPDLATLITCSLDSTLQGPGHNLEPSAAES